MRKPKRNGKENTSAENNQLNQENKKNSHNYVVVLQRTGYNCENYAKMF